MKLGTMVNYMPVMPLTLQVKVLRRQSAKMRILWREVTYLTLLLYELKIALNRVYAQKTCSAPRINWKNIENILGKERRSDIINEKRSTYHTNSTTWVRFKSPRISAQKMRVEN